MVKGKIMFLLIQDYPCPNYGKIFSFLTFFHSYTYFALPSIGLNVRHRKTGTKSGRTKEVI